MTQATLWPMGTVEAERPKPMRVRQTRGLWLFENKPAALAWARRHAPINAAAMDCVSAHPRAVKVDTGEFCLVYDGCDNGPVKLVLLETGKLGRQG